MNACALIVAGVVGLFALAVARGENASNASTRPADGASGLNTALRDELIRLKEGDQMTAARNGVVSLMSGSKPVGCRSGQPAQGMYPNSPG